ncbi:MAG TPA: hypothetical protein VGE39_15440, partial [Prosthecobacter sp.]
MDSNDEPDPLEWSPEAIVADGLQLGKTPAEIAAKVKQWRGDIIEHGAKTRGDADPARYAAGVDEVDADVTEALKGLRGEATSRWVKETFGKRPEDFERFLMSVESGPSSSGSFDQEKKAFFNLQGDEAYRVPMRARQWHPLLDAKGSEIGRMQFIDRGGERDVLLSYDAPEGGGQRKQARLVVPVPQGDELIREAEGSEERAKQSAEEAARTLAMYRAHDVDEKALTWQAVEGKSKEAVTRELQRAEGLRDPAQGAALLTSERVMDQVRKGPLKDVVGRRGLAEDFNRGLARFFVSGRVAFNDMTGDTAERDEWRQHLQALRQYFPGSTGPKNTEGVGGFVSDAAEGAGGMVPQMLAMAAGGVPGVSNAVAGGVGGASLGSMGMSAYGAGVDETLSRAAQMDEDATKLDAVDPKGARQLREQAAGLRAKYRGIAAMKAGVEVLSEKILPEQNILRGGMGATALRRAGTVAGKSFLEGVAAEAGGQLVNNAAFGDPLDAVQVLRGGALEVAAGAPMIAAGGLMPQRRAGGAAGVAVGSEVTEEVGVSVVAPVAEEVGKRDARPTDGAGKRDVRHAIETGKRDARPTIGGRPVLLGGLATAEEREQMERDPAYWRAAERQIGAQVAAAGEAEKLDALPGEGTEAPVPTMADIATGGGLPAETMRVTLPTSKPGQQPADMTSRDEAGQPPGVEPAPSTATAAAEAAAVEVKAPKRWRMKITAREDGVTDVLDFMAGEGIKLDRPPREKKDRMGRITNAHGEHDAMKRLRKQLPAYYRAMTTENGYKPDEAAQILHEAGFISEPTPDAVAEAIETAVGQRRSIRGKAREERLQLAKEERGALRQGERQNASWRKANQPRGERDAVASEDMVPGMTMEVDGEPMTVLEVDYDEDGNWNGALIEDGDKFGRQWVDNGEVVHADADTVQAPAAAESGQDFDDLAVAAAAEDFNLQAQSAEEMAAEQAKAAEREKIRERQQRPLSGNAGEFGTPDMLDNTAGPMALFNQGGGRGRLQFSKAREFIDMATAKARLAVGNVMGRVFLGTVTARAAALTKAATGIDTTDVRVNLNLEAWRHADKQHGSGSNAKLEESKQSGQVPLTPEDIDLVAPTVLDADAVGLVLNPDALRRAAREPEWVPQKEYFHLVHVKEVDGQFIVASSLPNSFNVANVKTVWKQKVRQGFRAEDVLQEILQLNASQAGRALAQEETKALLEKRQAMDATGSRPQASQGGGARVTAKSVQDALMLIAERLPGLLSGRVRVHANAGELLASDYARRESFTAEEAESMQDAEGFYDPLTGQTILFTEQISLREGETPIRAVARVLLHERTGHEGVNVLMETDPVFKGRVVDLAGKIPSKELDVIATQAGYEHLAGDRVQLALEWLARQVERVEGGRNAAAIEGGLNGVAKQMWQAVKEALARFFAGFSRKAALAHEVAEIITLAREAALNGTADPTTAEGLVTAVQFSLGGSRVGHRAGTPYRVNDRVWRSIVTGTPLPSVFVEAVEATERERKALDQRTAQVGRDLKVAVEAHAERTGTPIADVYERVNLALSGAPGTNAVMMQTDPVLHMRALEARALLDTMSDAVARTLPVGDLRNTIMLNQGAWMRRAYAAFDPASGWHHDAVMQAAREGRMLGGRDARAIVTAARVFLKQQNPSASAEEITADMRDLMDRDTVANALTGAAAVRKNVTSLLMRRDIPKELRELMGEEKNPIKRFLQSTSWQAQFIHRHQQQLALRRIGLSNGLFAMGRGGPDGVFNTQIPAGDRSWGGLAGLWTTPQLWAALQNVRGANTGNDLWSKAGEMLKALGNEAKLNRVAMNPDSWMVNILGNAVALVQTGDVFYWSIFRRAREAYQLMQSGKAKPADVGHNVAIALQNTNRAMVARLTASGVLGQNFNLRDLEASVPRHLLAW